MPSDPMKRVTLRVTPKVRRALERAGAASGETMSAICRRILRAHMKRAARAMGLHRIDGVSPPRRSARGARRSDGG